MSRLASFLVASLGVIPAALAALLGLPVCGRLGRVRRLPSPGAFVGAIPPLMPAFLVFRRCVRGLLTVRGGLGAAARGLAAVLALTGRALLASEGWANLHGLCNLESSFRQGLRGRMGLGREGGERIE